MTLFWVLKWFDLPILASLTFFSESIFLWKSCSSITTFKGSSKLFTATSPLSSLKCLEKLMEETEHIETLQMLITTIAGGSVWFFLRVFNCQKFYNFQSLGMLFCSIQLYLSFCLCLCLFLITANISTVTYLLDHSIVFNTIRVITTLSVVMTLIVGGNRRIKKGKAKICGFTYC